MFTSLTAWILAAVAAVGGGVLALVLISTRIGTPGTQPVAAAANSPEPVASTPAPAAPVASRPRVTPTTPAAPAPPRTPAGAAGTSKAPRSSPDPSPSSAAPTEQAFTTAGGVVDAQCSAAGAYLMSWSPATGYRIVTVNRGPAPQTSVVFGGAQTITVTVTCSAGAPQATVQIGRPDD